jgi:hypothetical protein
MVYGFYHDLRHLYYVLHTITINPNIKFLRDTTTGPEIIGKINIELLKETLRQKELHIHTGHA